MSFRVLNPPQREVTWALLCYTCLASLSALIECEGRKGERSGSGKEGWMEGTKQRPLQGGQSRLILQSLLSRESSIILQSQRQTEVCVSLQGVNVSECTIR